MSNMIRMNNMEKGYLYVEGVIKKCGWHLVGMSFLPHRAQVYRNTPTDFFV